MQECLFDYAALNTRSFVHLFLASPEDIAFQHHLHSNPHMSVNTSFEFPAGCGVTLRQEAEVFLFRLCTWGSRATDLVPGHIITCCWSSCELLSHIHQLPLHNSCLHTKPQMVQDAEAQVSKQGTHGNTCCKARRSTPAMCASRLYHSSSLIEIVCGTAMLGMHDTIQLLIN
jgi:hypothetical protein